MLFSLKGFQGFLLFIFSLDFFFAGLLSAKVITFLNLVSTYQSLEQQDRNHSGIELLNSKRHKEKKRSSQKKLGESCTVFKECPAIALCMNGICSCPYDYYSYVSQHKSVCRKKSKFGFFCTFGSDCKAHDLNSVCSDSVCKCINGTHYIGSRNLLIDQRKCYKILEREGDVCEIDEQCSRLADNHHKCKCVGKCDCANVNKYGGCSVCHENIKRTFFGGAAFIIILLTSRLFSKMRRRSNLQHQRNLTVSSAQEPYGRMPSSNTVPSVSQSHRNLQIRQHTASLPDVFLIEHQNLMNLPSSQAPSYFLQDNPFPPEAMERNEDIPPSYDDIVESDQLVWCEPPPAYDEIALKCIQPRKP